MIHVIATVEVVAGKRAEALAEFGRIVPLVRAEAGCVEYGAAVDVPAKLPVLAAPRPDAFVVVEKWETLDALRAHLAAPHMVEYRQKVAGLVAKVSLQVLEPV